jgi:hypothetical protein
MVDFRKWFPALAVAAFFIGSAVTASAQITPALSCVSNAGATPLVRAEGITELVGDVVLNCTGGIATPVGQQVPAVNIQVFLNTNITSRLDSSSTFSEALIIIDDPLPANLVPCTTSTCVVQGSGVGTGVNFKSGGVPNVYQARTSGANSVTWLGVPVDPPGTNGTRTLRITNVHANASQLGTSSTLIPTQITMFISIVPQQALPLNNPSQTVAYVSKGLNFSLRKPDNSGSTSGVTFLQCINNNKDISGDNTKALNNGLSFLARFSEGFATAFKRRNNAINASADTAPAPINQDNVGGLCSSAVAGQCIGGQYFTETGFYGGSTGPLSGQANGLSSAGLADTGTRLMLNFANVPAGAQIFVGTYEIVGTTAATATTSRVRLVSTDANGAGAFSAVTATSAGPPALAPVAITGGAGIAVYEVMKSDPQSSENIDIPVVVAFTSSTATNVPGLGTATVTGSFAPISTVITQSASAPIPRFIASPINATAFTINACSTNLLFPFVANQAGFDTGLAIANTSQDPFGTSTQSGACILNYYGNTNGGAAPAKVTSPVVPAGTELIWLLSTTSGGIPATPGFEGYIIAQCAFQYAHGFAFITDVGAQKLAEGYLALILDAPIATRGTQSETLGQ